MVQLEELTNLTGRSEFTSQVKTFLSDWISKKPHINITDFKEKAVINEILSLPAYKLSIQTQYETRNVSIKSVPFKSQKTGERKFFKIEDVDLWSYNLDSVNEFKNYSKDWSIPGSEDITACKTCSSRGIVSCYACQGLGKINCSNCNSTGVVKCSSCSGSGFIGCSSCGGSGRTTAPCGCSGGNVYGNYGKLVTCSRCGGSGRINVSCSRCSGQGRISCSSCGGKGGEYCGYCHGDGKVVCSNCSGRGELACSDCMGSGRLLNYFCLTQTFLTSSNNKIKLHRKIQDAYSDLSDLLNEAGGQSVFYKEKCICSINDLREYGLVDADYRNLIIIVDSFVNKDYKRNKIRFQNLSLKKIPIYLIKYGYRNSQYSVIIYGTENKIYAPVSPLSEAADDFLKNAGKLYDEGEYSNSLDEIEKVDDLQQSKLKDDVIALRTEIISKINKDYTVSTFITGISIGTLFAFFSYFYFKNPVFILEYVQKYFNESSWLPLFHNYTLLLIWITFLIKAMDYSNKFLKDRFGLHIKNKKHRYAVSAIFTTLFAISAWLYLLIFDLTGLSIILTALVRLSYSVISVFF